DSSEARPKVACRDGRNLLSPPPLSPGDHPACGLALSALRVELSRRRRTSRRAGVDISYETVRCWVLKFGTVIARRLRRCRPWPQDVGTDCRRADASVACVDHEGEVLDMARHSGGVAADA